MSQEQLEKFLVRLHLSPPDHAHDEKHASDQQTNETHCYSAEQLIAFFPNSQTLSQQQFNQLLPTMVYELHTDACHHEHSEFEINHSIGWKAIVGSTVSVIVISISGLIVVALIPLIPRRFFNIISQFLIALSVGSLIGDAFLHLIPHALAPPHDHSHEEVHNPNEASHDHREMTTKSLVALLGIYVFFLTERLTILCQNRTSRRKMKRQRTNISEANWEEGLTYHATSGAEQNSSALTNTDKQEPVNSSQATGFRNKEPGMFKPELAVEGVENSTLTPGGMPTARVDDELCNRPPERPLDNARCADHLSDPVNSERSMNGDFTTNNVPDLHSRTKLADSVDLSDNDLRTGKPAKWKPTTVAPESKMPGFLEDSEEQPTHPHRDKPHGHHHGHSHDLSSMRAIAYTVIIGDGLHNFCDGIAIGAAFSIDIRGGLSTAIAVLCHELPHELGDFAVLLHAGMSVKAAVFYNLLSSVLCAAGTVLGLLLGGFASIDTWLFMLTAGMFVYIALVNMMPELATNRLKGQRFCHRPSSLFIWQNIGILLGYGVMLLIAFYEKQFV